MAEKSWLKKIGLLKRLLSVTGKLWGGTLLSGYEERGPYHCGDCEYLVGLKKGKAVLDDKGLGRCNHPVVIADIKVLKDSKGLPIVNLPKGCCEFVEPISGE